MNKTSIRMVVVVVIGMLVAGAAVIVLAAANSQSSTAPAANPAQSSAAPLNTNWDKITLTDLEGNAVIYDNDGIKINFPPGFDMSKVGEIIWYRNGIPEPFLNNKLQITNAEMKTFMGYPTEHSPRSYNTDHAIAGYIYSVAIFPKGWSGSFDWVSAKKTLTTTVKSTFRWRPKEIWAEMAISWHWKRADGYSLSKIVKFLNYLKQDGFTGISLDIPFYVMTPYDSKILKVYYPDPKIATRGGIVTPTTSELEKMLKAAQEAGMEVHIRGHFYISQEYKNEHDANYLSSSFIDPNNPQRFFDNYADLLLKSIVPLLNKYHVKLFTPFVEMDRIEKYPDLLKKMYTTISAQFEGEMGFDEATNTMSMGNSPINHTPIHTVSEFERLVKNFTFWNWKDSHERPMRIEYSCWAPPVETQKDQRVSVMEPNFVKFWRPAVDYYRSTYPEDPQMFGEIGAYDADGQSLGPAYWHLKNKILDEQEVADFLYAAFQGAKELEINYINFSECFYVGDWSTPTVGSSRIVTWYYENPETPAYRVITAIIGPDTSDK